MDNNFVIELSNGQEVELNECGSKIEVIDCETNGIIATINGSLPDTEDEDFDMDAFIKHIENEISWSENY